MKALRIIGIVFAVLLALLIAGVALLYAMFDGDKIKAEISRAVLEQKQRTLVIAGKPQLSIWPNVGIQLDGVSLSERASTTEFAALESARVSVAVLPLLSKQVQVSALDLVGLKATLIKRKDGTLNIADLLEPTDGKAPETKPADAPQSADPLQIDIKSIRIANAQLTWRDELAGTTTAVSNLSLSSGRVQADTGKKTASVDALALSIKGSKDKDTFALTLNAPKLLLSPEKSSSDTITLTAQLQGPQRTASVNLALGGVESNADALKIGNLVLKLDAKAGDTTVKGQLSSPVAVNVQAQTVALAKLAGNVELALPNSPVKQVNLPINGALRVDALKQSAALELATQFDESKIATSVQVSKFAPLALAFDLNIDKLNVDKYLPPKTEQAAPAKEAGIGKEAPLDFSALKGPTVNGAIRIGALQVSNLKLANINAKLALSSGKLDVAPLSLNLYEGSASGNVSVNANGNVVVLRQTLAGISINPLMKDLLNKDMLEGRGTVALDIATWGDTVSALKKALGGNASLSLKDGAIKGINLAQSLRDIKAKLGQADATQQANANQKTDFSELSGTFKIAKGVAHNDDLSMKSPFIRLGGVGDIDVGESQMNYLAKATVVASGEGQGGQDLGQLKGLTIPVRLSGPFDKLSYKLELGAALEGAAKAKVEERVKEVQKDVQKQAEDKVKDALKGLLGR